MTREKVDEWLLAMEKTSICGLGQASPVPVRNAMRWWRPSSLPHSASSRLAGRLRTISDADVDALRMATRARKIGAMVQLPSYVRELFWEGLRDDPDPDRHADYIAIRVLEYGDEPAYRWLVERFGRERVRRVVASGRLRPHHARFWQDVLVDARGMRRS